MNVLTLSWFLALPSFAPPPSEPAPPPIVQTAAVEERLGTRLPDKVSLLDSRGHGIDLRRLYAAPKPLVLVLAYYRCPMLCGLNLSGLARALKESGLEIGKDYHALTVSFDPHDRPDDAARIQSSVLARLGRPEARDHWPFAVGSEESTRAMADAVGFRYARDERTGQYAHPAVSFVLAPGGVVSRYLYGIEPSTRDVKLALLEPASAPSSLVDRVFMTCFRYDPASRAYAPYLLGFVRIGAFLIFVLVAALGVYLFRLERRRRT